MVCFDGPAAVNGPVGFVLLSNGDNQAMFMNCGIAKELLKRLEIGGMEWSKVRLAFGQSGRESESGSRRVRVGIRSQNESDSENDNEVDVSRPRHCQPPPAPPISVPFTHPRYQVDGKDFSTEGLQQAEIVNLGLKELVLEALVDDPTWKPRARL